jgi:hypothetical protein
VGAAIETMEPVRRVGGNALENPHGPGAKPGRAACATAFHLNNRIAMIGNFSKIGTLKIAAHLEAVTQ